MASRRSIGWAGTLVLAVLLAGSGSARAQELEPEPQPAAPESEAPAEQEAAEPTGEGPLGAPALPLAWAERPLTLTAQTIRADGRFGMRRYVIRGFDPVTGAVTRSSDVAVELALGAGYGIIDDIEVGAEVLPLRLSPRFEYYEPSLYGLFRFVSGTVDVGALLRITFPVEGRFMLDAGVPVLVHLGSVARLDTGAFFDLTVPRHGDRAIFSILVPADLAFNVTPEIFLGIGTALLFPDLEEDGEPVQSLDVFAGYTVPAAQGPLADIRVRFQFPGFVYYGAGEGQDTIVTEEWELVVRANVYFNH